MLRPPVPAPLDVRLIQVLTARNQPLAAVACGFALRSIGQDSAVRIAANGTLNHGNAPTRRGPTMERSPCHHTLRQGPPTWQTALAADGVVKRCPETAQQGPQPPDRHTLLAIRAVAEGAAAAEICSKGRTAATVYELAAHALGPRGTGLCGLRSGRHAGVCRAATPGAESRQREFRRDTVRSYTSLW
jgi:hypothetical protein